MALSFLGQNLQSQGKDRVTILCCMEGGPNFEAGMETIRSQAREAGYDIESFDDGPELGVDPYGNPIYNSRHNKAQITFVKQ